MTKWVTILKLNDSGVFTSSLLKKQMIFWNGFSRSVKLGGRPLGMHLLCTEKKQIERRNL